MKILKSAIFFAAFFLLSVIGFKAVDAQTAVVSSGPSLANWNTYVNQRYGYSIKYPSGWFVDTTYSESDFTPRGANAQYIGGDTTISNYSSSSFNGHLTFPSDYGSINLMVYKSDPAISLNDFASNEGIGAWPGIGNAENININGISGLEWSFPSSTLADDTNYGYPGAVIFLKTGVGIFYISYGSVNRNSAFDQTAESVIDSFTSISAIPVGATPTSSTVTATSTGISVTPTIPAATATLPIIATPTNPVIVATPIITATPANPVITTTPTVTATPISSPGTGNGSPATQAALQQELTQLLTTLLQLLQQAAAQGLLSASQLSSALSAIWH